MDASVEDFESGCAGYWGARRAEAAEGRSGGSTVDGGKLHRACGLGSEAEQKAPGL